MSILQNPQILGFLTFIHTYAWAFPAFMAILHFILAIIMFLNNARHHVHLHVLAVLFWVAVFGGLYYYHLHNVI